MFIEFYLNKDLYFLSGYFKWMILLYDIGEYSYLIDRQIFFCFIPQYFQPTMDILCPD